MTTEGTPSGPRTTTPAPAPANDADARRPSARASGEASGPTTPPAPPSPRRSRRQSALVGYLSGVFTFLTLLALGVGGAFYWGKSTFDAPGPLAAETTVMVPRNQGVSDIAASLAAAGVIDHPKLFEAGVRLYRANDRLRFGEYAFPARVSMREAMEILTSGRSIEHAITIPEGLTSLQIVDRLRDIDLLTGDVKEIPPEGALLPETYRVMRGTSREQVLARMRQSQKAALEEVWRGRDPSVPVKTPDDLLVLASLIEKETGVAAERTRVAAVFVNRLRKGMRLQSDPTIVYGLVGGRGTLGRSLTRTDIQSRTPYNTYVINGLPAGPIANPGRASLEAAARPDTSGELYFVADGTGGHAFAATLAEHNRNVQRWRQVERARGAQTDRAAPDEAAPEPEGGSAAAPGSTAPRR
ncbi:endolytic transglycosylase MltG [Methylopila turkensis]|uniref:Endolytic murein transglycosylase n=1 Tax=Methylopila turkensis TaxID=1437816 RepID=A0A9W6JP84_9HYPH|nr:endolytic transglycosylase MltG [Methylopila turkensis]GLK80001.1 aminodeoxychorismate lyase [Methylopila turkensis]